MSHPVEATLKRNSGGQFNGIQLIKLLRNTTDIKPQIIKELVAGLKRFEPVEIKFNTEDNLYLIQETLKQCNIKMTAMLVEYSFTDEEIVEEVADILENINDYCIIDGLVVYKPTNSFIILELEEAFKLVKQKIEEGNR